MNNSTMNNSKIEQRVILLNEAMYGRSRIRLDIDGEGSRVTRHIVADGRDLISISYNYQIDQYSSEVSDVVYVGTNGYNTQIVRDEIYRKFCDTYNPIDRWKNASRMVLTTNKMTFCLNTETDLICVLKEVLSSLHWKCRTSRTAENVYKHFQELYTEYETMLEFLINLEF